MVALRPWGETCDRPFFFLEHLAQKINHQKEATGPVSIATSPESVEKSLHAAGRLVFQDFDAAFHLLGRGKKKQLALANQALPDGVPGAAALTSILEDLAKAPTGWT